MRKEGRKKKVMEEAKGQVFIVLGPSLEFQWQRSPTPNSPQWPLYIFNSLSISIVPIHRRGEGEWASINGQFHLINGGFASSFCLANSQSIHYAHISSHALPNVDRFTSLVSVCSRNLLDLDTYCTVECTLLRSTAFYNLCIGRFLHHFQQAKQDSQQ